MRTTLALTVLALAPAARAQDGILWYSGNSTGISGLYSPVTVSAAASNLGVPYTETATWPTDFTPYRVVFLGLSEASYSSGQEADLASFLGGGGVLVLVGDADGYSSLHTSVYNSLLANLGYGSQFLGGSIDAGCSVTATTIGSHPINAGVTGLQYAWSGDLALGVNAVELQRGASGQVVAAVEGNVVMSTDSTQFLDLCALPSPNTLFVENIWSQVGPVNCDADADGYDAVICGGTDCLDTDPTVNPAGTETMCDGVDNDCDPLTVDDTDFDGDGAGTCIDCDDTNAYNFPGNVEVCDGLDNDCDSAIDNGLSFSDYWPDGDGDGFGDGAATPENACAAPVGWVANDQDCDDGDAAVSPAAVEVVCDGADNDCDAATLDDRDQDADGVGQCTDCDDFDAGNFPGNPETCDGLDNDCDGAADNGLFVDWYPDGDGDGFGDAQGTPVNDCVPPTGHVDDDTDCDDTDASVFPGATDVPGNGLDEDCDGLDASGGTGTGTGSTAVEDPKLGCGCDTSTAPTSAAWLLLGGLVALRRRDR